MTKTIYLAAPTSYRESENYERIFYLVAHNFRNNLIIEEPGVYDLLILVRDEDHTIDRATYDQVTDAYLAGKLVQLAILNRKQKLSLLRFDELTFETFDEHVRVERKLMASPVKAPEEGIALPGGIVWKEGVRLSLDS